MEQLSPNKVCFVASEGCTYIQGMWKHWLCHFPQHGPGRKHERAIILESWQRDLVEADPRPLLRGLFHSDGCRCNNRVTVRGKAYDYPRYFFSNRSTDIMTICQQALDHVGVEWRMNNWFSLSVARKSSVAKLDTFIGPKA